MSDFQEHITEIKWGMVAFRGKIGIQDLLIHLIECFAV
jgi:hypothetical protein